MVAAKQARRGPQRYAAGEDSEDKFHMRISPETKSRLQRFATLRGVSCASYIRMALQEQMKGDAWLVQLNRQLSEGEAQK